jgi:hypothetical protein
MKTISACFILIIIVTFTCGADRSDVILQAQTDATDDGRNYHACWWGVGGAAMTVLPFLGLSLIGDAIPVEARRAIAFTFPVLGGASLGLIGYFSGKAEVPNARISEIQIEYDDSSLLSLYETEYKKTLTSIQRRRRGSFALIGAGVAVGAVGIGFLVLYMTK